MSLSIAVQSDGKIIIGGNFTTFNGTTVNRIVRLNSDGTRDTTFTTNTGTAFNSAVDSIAIQSDGKIICGGSFTTFNGVTVNRIVRLNSDGTRDTAFSTNIGTGFTNNVWSIAIQSDGKIVVGGAFITFNGVTVNRIVRLNSDGTRDATFTTNTGTAFNNSNSIAIQSDGKIVCVGFFTTFNGTTVNRIVRLNSDGTRDTTFTTNTGTAFNDAVNSVAIQSDGKITAVGSFFTFNGTMVNCIVRLNSNGTRDTTFTANAGAAFSSGVNSMAIQSDGKVICGGNFTTFNGVTVNRIVRLNSDGTRDATFTTNTGTAFDNSNEGSIAIQSDNKIVCGGEFTTFNGTIVSCIVRLNSDGTRDTTFTTNTGTAFTASLGSLYWPSVASIAIQSDGKIVCGGEFNRFNGTTVTPIVRLNSDGTRDTTFTTNTGTGLQFISTGLLNPSVASIAIQSDGKIVIVGFFEGFNGTTVNSIVRLNSDGTRDTTFTTNTGTSFSFGSRVESVAIQSDGKIICGGSFTTFNGVTVNRIVRLNSDGTRDTTFTTNTGTAFNSGVGSIAIQSDGKLVIGGVFTTFNGVTVNRIVRLNSDGTRDTTFTTNTGTAFSNFNNRVDSIAIQSDGKIICGGQFTSFNNINRTHLVRIGGE
jgi:uncharacterized delta-60 repeat protein